MRATRLRVDELLASGMIDKAEAYMEERRQFLADNGYYIRKLNQAYFAFHGSYADSAASVSPIHGQLEAVRQASDSLGEFVRMPCQAYQATMSSWICWRSLAWRAERVRRRPQVLSLSEHSGGSRTAPTASGRVVPAHSLPRT